MNGRSSLGGDRRTSGASADDVRAAESVARQSQERLLELVAARHAREREAKEAREMAARWEFEVGERRAEMEVAQGELEASLELERVERRKAEEEYAKARDERDVLERLVEQRAEEIGSLEEKLQDATNAAATLKADCEERDALLRDGAAMLEAKEHELDEAATYALQLQQQLEQLEVERAEEEAKMQALKAKYPRTPMKSTPSPERGATRGAREEAPGGERSRRRRLRGGAREAPKRAQDARFLAVAGRGTARGEGEGADAHHERARRARNRAVAVTRRARPIASGRWRRCAKKSTREITSCRRRCPRSEKRCPRRRGRPRR